MPGGRPTEYKPEFCDDVVAWGRDGKSKTWMAAQIGVSRDTLYEWERVHPEFSDALSLAMAHSQAWWEDAGQTGMLMSGFSASAWSKAVSCRFPADYTEKTKQELSGPNGAPLLTALQVELVKPQDDNRQDSAT